MEQNIWRKDFPQITEKDMVYLDSAASSLKPLSVIAAIDHYYHDLSTNIHRGVYKETYEATRLYEEAREKIAAFIHAKTEEVIFTRGATSALNLVALTYGMENVREGDEIIVSELEHHSSVLPWQRVAQKTKATLVYVPLNAEGRITVEAFRSVLSDKTKVVALTYVSNVMGYISPMREIIALSHEKQAIVVVDAAQAVQHMHLDVVALDADFLAFSGHKMLGPTGIGILYGKEALLKAMEPLELGGDMNDNVNKDDAEWKDLPYKFEAGTMPIAEVIGLGSAVDYWNASDMTKMEDHVRRLRFYTVAQLKKMPEITIYNPNADTGVIAFNLKNVHSHDAATFFAEKNVCLRAGHHCAQLLVKWLGIEASLRASFYFYNTYADCDRFIEAVKGAIVFFRKMGF
jgi:cysteine desulfurase/selenocysteine lyase